MRSADDGAGDSDPELSDDSGVELSGVELSDDCADVAPVSAAVFGPEGRAADSDAEVTLVIRGLVEKSPESLSIIRMAAETTKAAAAMAIRVQRTLVLRERPGSSRFT